LKLIPLEPVPFITCSQDRHGVYRLALQPICEARSSGIGTTDQGTGHVETGLRRGSAFDVEDFEVTKKFERRDLLRDQIGASKTAQQTTSYRLLPCGLTEKYECGGFSPRRE
jgi:hypothetical protein